MKLAIIGTGYVGLVTGACFAELGNQVICADNDLEKISQLKNDQMPLYEPGLEEIVLRNRKEGRLRFSSVFKETVENCEVIFITVGTPDKGNGEADLSAVEAVAREIGSCINGYKLIVEKSTVPVETGKWIERTLRLKNKDQSEFDVASNPEFLREGSAVSDFMNPDRIVVGVESPRAEKILRDLYRSFTAPIIVTDIKSAELIKHASNSFLATKISFINAVSNICERVGADIVKVAQGIGLDQRIGPDFLKAGIGFGGSCFPKDLAAFIHLSEKLGYDFKLLKAVQEVNHEQSKLFLRKIEQALWILKGKTVGVMGLSFKPGTDDLRNAPALAIIETLTKEGVTIKAYDPKAMPKAKKLLSDVIFCQDCYELAEGSDCLVLLTEWDEFKNLRFKEIKSLMRQPILMDGRNLYDPVEMMQMGFIYISVGRGSLTPQFVEWAKPALNLQ